MRVLFDIGSFGSLYAGFRVEKVEPKFEQKIKLGDVGIEVDGVYVDLVSKDVRDKFNKFLLDTFGVRDVTLMKRGQAFIAGNSLIIRSDDAAVIKFDAAC